METKIDKRHRIIEQAKIEFSEHLFEEASINRIIKAINMPRGTFYLYFENKEELYFAMLELLEANSLEEFKKIAFKNKGNTRKIFINLYEKACNTKLKLIRNIFINFNTNHFDKIFPKKKDKINLSDYFNFKEFNLKNEEEEFIFVHLLFTILIQNICLSVKHKENAKDFFIKQIDMVIKGKEKN